MLLISLSLSIIVDAVNKLINPHQVEDPTAMIFLGSAGVFIGLLGLFLFRGYHHDHNIGNEIVEQKKNDFVQSVYTTLRNLDLNQEQTVVEEKSPPFVTQPMIIPELIITESTTTINIQTNSTNNLETTKKKRQFQQDLILPSLHATYKNAFIVADQSETSKETTNEHQEKSDQQLRVPDQIPMGFMRTRSKSGDSMTSSTFVLDENQPEIDEEFQESRVFATLHALCLHSLVKKIFVVDR